MAKNMNLEIWETLLPQLLKVEDGDTFRVMRGKPSEERPYHRWYFMSPSQEKQSLVFVYVPKKEPKKKKKNEQKPI